MAGGGNQNLEPGRFMGAATALMKALGLGIAARGGALGPMLVTGGELVDEGYAARRERVRNQILLKLLEPIRRSEETTGIPERLGAPVGARGMPAGQGPPRSTTGAGPPTLGESGLVSVPGGEPLSFERSRRDPDTGELIRDVLTMPRPPGVAVGPIPPAMPEDPEAVRASEARALAPVSAGDMTLTGNVGVPPTRREWTGVPTQAEVLQRLIAAGLPVESLRGELLRDVLGLRLPTDVERPQAVTEELQRARERETQERQFGALTPAMTEGATPEQRARASVLTGREVQPPPSERQWVQRGDGTVQEVDRRTGRPIGPPVLQRTAEEEAQRTQVRDVLIPQYEREFEAAVKAGIYTPSEAAVGRQRLERAKITGDVEPFLKFTGDIAEAREKAKRAAGRRVTHGETRVREHPVTSPEVVTAYKPFVADVIARLKTAGYVGFDDPAAADVRSPEGKIESKEHAIAVKFQDWYHFRPDLRREASGEIVLHGLWIPEGVTERFSESGPEPEEPPIAK